MGLSLQDLFPELLDGARGLYETLALVAVVMLFAGLVLAAYRGAFGNLSEIVKGLVTVGVLVVVIASFPDWVDEFQMMASSVVTELGADPSDAHTRYAELLVGEDEAAEEETGFWDILWSDNGGIGKALIYAFVLLFGKIAWLVMWLVYVVQQFVLIYGIATSPIFISMMVFNATRGIAVRYFMSLLGVALWPLGWALASMMTDALLEMAANERIYVVGGSQAAHGTQTLFLILLVGIWMLVSTIATPRLINQLIQNGSQIGAAVLGTVGGSVSRGVGYGVGGGVAASLAGAGPGAAAAAAAIGGTSGLVSSAAGTSGTLGSATIGAVAAIGMGSASGGDINQQAATIARENQQ